MNTDTLKKAEENFLTAYPGGFDHPEMLAIGKKHQFEKRVAQAQEWFVKSAFDKPDWALGAMVKLISASSFVSVFEKPKFRDAVKELPPEQQQRLASGLRDWLHGNSREGFEEMLQVLSPLKLAKWSIMTLIPACYRPHDEVFLKPTTVKGIIDHFELQNLHYQPKPGWEFYDHYRNAILEMKKRVHPSLGPSNAAFCGFLMMSLDVR